MNSKTAMTSTISTAMVLASTQAIASMEKPVDLSEIKVNTADEKMAAAIDKALAKKDVKQMMGDSLFLLSSSFTDDDKKVLSDKYALNNDYGTIDGQGSHGNPRTRGTRDSVWTSGDSYSYGRSYTCYTNCHSACHGACHGSRGWR